MRSICSFCKEEGSFTLRLADSDETEVSQHHNLEEVDMFLHIQKVHMKLQPEIFAISEYLFYAFRIYLNLLWRCCRILLGPEGFLVVTLSRCNILMYSKI